MINPWQYSLEHDVFYSETDFHGRLSPSALFALFQEIAVRNAEMHGFGKTYCEEKNRMWVLSRAQIEIDRYPVQEERIVLSTWPKGSKGPFALRDVEFKSLEGESLIRGTSSWLLLDITTMRPVRPEEIMKHFPNPEEASAIDAPAPKLSFKGTPVREYTLLAGYTDLDHHNHVNNTHYLRWSMNCFTPEELENRRVKKITINYNKLVEWNETVRINRADEDGTVYISGTKDNGEGSFILAAELTE